MTRQARGTNRRRWILKLLAAAALSCLLAGCQTPSAREAQSENFFFIQMADPQIPWGPRELWEKAIAEANRLKPDFVVVTGDLTNPAGDEEQTRMYLETARKLDPKIRLYNVAGNHDVTNTPTPESLAWYEKHYGELWYTFEHKGSLFIVLESTVINSPGKAPQAADRQMRWLKDTLARADKRNFNHKIVFMHHPLGVKSVDENVGWPALALAPRKGVLEVFEAHGVTAVFAGHWHRNACVEHKGMEFVTTASSGKPLGDDPAGFRIVKVYPDRIEHEYYSYAELPAKVEVTAP